MRWGRGKGIYWEEELSLGGGSRWEEKEQKGHQKVLRNSRAVQYEVEDLVVAILLPQLQTRGGKGGANMTTTVRQTILWHKKKLNTVRYQDIECYCKHTKSEDIV